MPSKTVDLSAAEAAFRADISATYELTDDVIDAIVGFMRKAVESNMTAATSTRAPAAAAASPAAGGAAVVPKQRRKKSAYNIYVRTMMQTPTIKSLDHKEKMSAIASSWKLLGESDKAEYTSLAKTENESTEEVVEQQ